jgi:adenosylcobinamide-phosphate synthase
VPHPPGPDAVLWLVWLWVSLASILDRLVGDPRGCLHPVQVMGWWIARLRAWAETVAGDRPAALRWAGLLITLLVVGCSGLAGWGVERLAVAAPLLGLPLLLIGLASALAGGSLRRAVHDVLGGLPDLQEARRRLAWVVGRDVSGLDEPEILRAAAETASENAVDGLFAPLFWMLVGAALWSLAAARGGQTTALVPTALPPGPLALAWVFKAASTLDSMLGYKRGRLLWMGTAGARLDDALTWLPCRLVALTLPLAAGQPGQVISWLRVALSEGAADPSPNAGVSQAAYAHAAAVRLGGLNRYPEGERLKPVLAAHQPPADREAVERILVLTDRLELLWLLGSGGLALLVSLLSRSR